MRYIRHAAEDPIEPESMPHPLFGPHVSPFSYDAKKDEWSSLRSILGSFRGKDPRRQDRCVPDCRTRGALGE